MSDADIQKLANDVREQLGDDAHRWYQPGRERSIALAVINSIYSTGHRFTGVLNALNRYQEARRADGADPSTDRATDLVDAAATWGGPQGLAKVTNAWVTSSKPGAPLKAEAAVGAARILSEAGLETVEDVVRELNDPARQEASDVKKKWLALPGQRSGITWTYFLMLCGVPGVKADRMVTRFVERSLDRRMDPRQVAQIVGHVADQLAVTHNQLDHAIWRLESGRKYLLDEGADV